MLVYIPIVMKFKLQLGLQYVMECHLNGILISTFVQTSLSSPQDADDIPRTDTLFYCPYL
jgi:hypothetical protein